MRILVTTVKPPFEYGDVDRLTDSLLSALRHAGHDADVWSVPLIYTSAQHVRRAIDIWKWDVLQASDGGGVDLVIPLRFPAYVPLHPRKVTWLYDQYRPAYDRWVDHAASAEDVDLKSIVVGLDKEYLSTCVRRFAVSEAAQNRLVRSTSLDTELLASPPPSEEGYGYVESLPYILAPGRLDGTHRHDLVIRALAQTRSELSLVIVGSGPLRQKLESIAQQLDVGRRVRFVDRVSSLQRSKLFASCLAVYVGEQESNLNFAPVEAMLSSKPVIVFSDGGAAQEHLLPNETGISIPPSVPALADALSFLADDVPRARRMGLSGRLAAEGLNRSWARVVDVLTAS